MPEFAYQDPFPLGPDSTRYRHLGSDLVSTATFDGQEILKVEPEALTLLAREALRDVSFLYRASHLAKVAGILDDPEASANDRGVALALLRNAAVASGFKLPMCQDTGTATIIGKKGQRVWTGGVKDEEWLSRGVYETYQKENLRYSQTIPLSMYEEINSGTNLPAQIDIFATPGETVRVPLRRQGRRIGEQVDALPGNQGAAQSRQPGDVSQGEAPLAGNGRVSAVSPGDRDRRDLGRGDDEDGQACQRGLSRHAADRGEQAGPGVPRPGARGTGRWSWPARAGSAPSSAASTSPSTPGSSGCPAMGPVARWASACRARPTGTSRRGSIETASGSRSWSAIRPGSSRRSTVRASGTSTGSRSISTGR